MEEMASSIQASPQHVRRPRTHMGSSGAATTPSRARILARYPSSCTSTSITTSFGVGSSSSWRVETSYTRSYWRTALPSPTLQRWTVPVVMVGESLGIGTSLYGGRLEHQRRLTPVAGRERERTALIASHHTASATATATAP
eukprot:scaffold23142_cov33-Tisochrysis_lutea.AAC.5